MYKNTTCELFDGRLLAQIQVTCYALFRNCVIIRNRIELQIMNQRFLLRKEKKVTNEMGISIASKSDFIWVKSHIHLSHQSLFHLQRVESYKTLLSYFTDIIRCILSKLFLFEAVNKIEILTLWSVTLHLDIRKRRNLNSRNLDA